MLCDVIYIEFIYLLLQHYHYCHWHYTFPHGNEVWGNCNFVVNCKSFEIIERYIFFMILRASMEKKVRKMIGDTAIT